ncbi:phosphoenolpyruvate--protein phosphotransferase [Chitinophaga parva]|uniref:Phosphoenolpyruvate-protein phosphotransferase n=1 Tax=Chitinophaga parva TaxID=2169414 RepID=A0A2T7BIN0_9BACT|nr:phosphoenolpyruvate--protein phosphotransferase [Chitinophaga parva]PUZ26102.1 phosphoenolpyruvate--protein phosphotransferase [Chitinophaga parva]
MKGIGVSPGIAIGKARVLRKKITVVSGTRLQNEAEIAIAIAQYDDAVHCAVAGVEALRRKVLLPEENDLLDAQIELLRDPQLKADVEARIREDRLPVQDAVAAVIAATVQLFRSLKDEYMQARTADIQDIGDRLLTHLEGTQTQADKDFAPGTILIAEDLSPADTIAMDTRHVTGFATQSGGQTSHAAIIAKARGVPAVVDCGASLHAIEDGDIVIVDGEKGLVLHQPDAATINAYSNRRMQLVAQQPPLHAIKDAPCVTTDGTPILLLGNISGAADLDLVFANGGQGAGLLRTELLFMSKPGFPSEATQYAFYKAAALEAKGKPVTIRTLDVGGDKQLPYFRMEPEQNPFLGYRAIRICLDEWKDIFRTQLRAILRASASGPLSILFPMITNGEELQAAKSLLEAEKQALRREGIAFDEGIETGIMIEVPAAALMADMLAAECNFFSIGTNDLCQYTMAADRMHPKVAALYDPFHPGFLRLVAQVIAAGHAHHIHVGMCGEMAADPRATQLLLGMGLREFSMSAASIPAVKSRVLQTSMEQAVALWQQVQTMRSAQDIIQYLQEKVP